MSAPLGIGKAFGEVISGERQHRDLQGAAQGAAAMFDALGTENGKQYAQLLRTDPRAAFVLGEQAGGMQELIKLEQANAARQRVATATAGVQPGSREYMAKLGPALIAEGEFGSGVNASMSGLPEDVEAGIPPELLQGIAGLTKQEQWDTLTQAGVAPDKAASIIRSLRDPQGHQSEEITFGQDGVTRIRRGTFGQESTEADTTASVAGLLDNIEDLKSLTAASPGTVGDPADIGRLGGRIGHTAHQTFGIGDSGTAESLTRAGSGGASPDDIARADTLTQAINIGLRPILADKGNLNKDERADLGVATGKSAWTPENRKASLEAVERLAIAHEFRRLRAIGRPDPRDPFFPGNEPAFIDYMRQRGYSDAEIRKMDDRLSQ